VTLTNTNNTISGAGDIGRASAGDNAMTFVNQASGIVNASATTNILFIDLGSKAVINHGLFESTGAGGLEIFNSTVDDRIATGTTAGTIEANGGNVLLHSADILGGLLTTATKGGGFIEAVDRGSVLDGSTKVGTTAAPVLVLGTVEITNNNYLTIDGTINLSQTVNKVTATGTIALQSGGNDTRLVVGVKNATLSKGGFVTMTDNSANSIVGTLTNTGNVSDVDNVVSKLTNNATISGAGHIGSELTLTNAGTIDATGANALIISTGDPSVAKSNIVTNTGTIESTNPNNFASTGGLVINGSIITGKASKVQANGAHTHVDLQSGTIQGGTLTTTGGGVIQAIDRGSVLDGSTTTAGAVNNKATVNILNNQYLTIRGTINNTASINLQSGGNDTRLRVGTGGATLTGSGTVALSDNSANTIDAAFAGVTLTNTNNTIKGAGDIGFASAGGLAMTFVNQASGIVAASGGNTLFLDFGSNVVTNAGLFEALGAGVLSIFNSTVNNGTVGIIEANGGNVDLHSADIIGGTLKTPSGVFETVDRGSLLDGSTSTVNNQGTVNILNNEYLTIQGTINNTGSIDLQSGGNDTRLRVGTGGATLSGSGTITLSNNSANTIDAAVASVTLTNTNDTIQGGGQLGGGSLGLSNSGTIDANVSTALVINTGGSAITNNGTLEATGATLQVDQDVTGTGSATINAGGRLDFLGAFSQNVNFAGSTGELDLAHTLTTDSQHYAGSISSSSPTLASGDIIVLNDMSFVNGQTTATYNTGTHVLAVTNGTVTADISILGTYSANVAIDNGSGKVEIHDPPLV
jgi:hypothetical protein